jgi:hypothetical protein
MVGEVALAHLEARLRDLRAAYQPDFIVINGENLAINIGSGGHGWCGMTPDLLARVFALGADVVTGGNHSWDGPYGRSIHDEPRLIRPLNYGRSAPGRGAIIVSKSGLRLGVVNVTSRSAMELADDPFEAMERQLEDWAGQTDAVLVDFHGESVTEKQTFGFAFDGRVTAVLGTHTHVATLDTQILPQGTAYVTDVGMTGPTVGVQGYAAPRFVHELSSRFPGDHPFTFALGPVTLGAVVVRFDGLRAVDIERIL